MSTIVKDKKQVKPVIELIVIKHIIDTNPDTSFIGEYSDTWQDGVIKRGNVTSREYKYFIPATSYKEHWQGLHKLGYSRGDCDYLARKYVYEDYNRMESLNRDDWYFIGIEAEAIVKYPIGQGNYRLEYFRSGGLWGIESDSKDYIKEVESDQLYNLKEHLKAFNISIKNFTKLAEVAEAKEVY